MKKGWKLFVLCLVCLTLFGTGQVQAEGEWTVKVYNDFEYSYDSVKDCIWLVNYIGNAEHAVVPATIEGKEVRYLNYAFENNQTIKKIELPDTIVDIGRFNGCTSLEEIVIPKKVKVIERHAFFGCSSLKKVVLPQGLKQIGEYAFSECTALERVYIPDGAELIGDGVFANCTNLKKVRLSKKIDTGSRTFLNCTKLTTVIMPNGIEVIGTEAFAGCKSLKTVKLPSTLEAICEYSFDGCAMREITIPKKVNQIQKGAFINCRKLKKIVIKSKKIEEWTWEQERFPFYNIHKKAVFDVPNSCITKYTKWLTQTGSFKEKTMKIK